MEFHRDAFTLCFLAPDEVGDSLMTMQERRRFRRIRTRRRRMAKKLAFYAWLVYGSSDHTLSIQEYVQARETPRLSLERSKVKFRADAFQLAMMPLRDGVLG